MIPVWALILVIVLAAAALIGLWQIGRAHV